MEYNDITIMAFRLKTGCKQYNFNSYQEMIKYFKKQWYKGELIHYFIILNGYFLGRSNYEVRL